MTFHKRRYMNFILNLHKIIFIHTTTLAVKEFSFMDTDTIKACFEFLKNNINIPIENCYIYYNFTEIFNLFEATVEGFCDTHTM